MILHQSLYTALIKDTVVRYYKAQKTSDNVPSTHDISGGVLLLTSSVYEILELLIKHSENISFVFVICVSHDLMGKRWVFKL